MTGEEKNIRLDRMRYTKNIVSSVLCYFAIIFDVLYFVNIYESDVGTWYYKLQIGSGIVYNLLFMLAVFLASEGVKNYKKSYSVPLIILGAAQIARIFFVPLQAHGSVVKLSGAEAAVMGDAQFIRCIIYLTVSAVCLCAAAVINYRKCVALKKYLETIGER